MDGSGDFSVSERCLRTPSWSSRPEPAPFHPRIDHVSDLEIIGRVHKDRMPEWCHRMSVCAREILRAGLPCPRKQWSRKLTLHFSLRARKFNAGALGCAQWRPLPEAAKAFAACQASESPESDLCCKGWRRSPVSVSVGLSRRRDLGLYSLAQKCSCTIAQRSTTGPAKLGLESWNRLLLLLSWRSEGFGQHAIGHL